MIFEQTVIENLDHFKPVLASAAKGAAAVKASSRMLDDGNLRSIGRKLSEAEEELTKAVEGLRAFREHWENCGLDGYFGSEEYLNELMGALEEGKVDHHRLDEVIYAYPALLRLEPNRKTVRIDKKTEARLRPKTLANLLREKQNRLSKFPAGQFLSAIFKIYKALASGNLKKSEAWAGKFLFLIDLYEVLSAAPGVDYSLQEFVRDIYLLDASGESLEVKGHIATLEQSAGTRNERKTLSIITRAGQKRKYCSIRFDPIVR